MATQAPPAEAPESAPRLSRGPWASLSEALDAVPNVVLIAIPALLGALLCAYKLADRSLWLDESATVSIASQHGHALWSAIAHDGGNMLAYYVMMHFVVGLAGDGEAVIRIPSVIGTAVSAGLTTALGLRLFERRSIGLAAGVLFAVSLPIIFWGQDARGYALMVTFSTAAFFAFVEIIRAPATRRAPRWAVVAYPACTVISLYIGYDAVLLVPAQLVVLWAFPERTRTVLTCLAASAVCCLPLVALAVARGSGQLFWVPPLTVHVLGQSGVTLFSTGMPPNFHERTLTTAATIFSAMLILYAVVAALRAWGGRRAAIEGTWTTLLCAAWVVVPCALGLLAAELGKPIELARCTILVMPGMALLLCWALLRSAVPRLAGIAAFGLLLLLRWIPLSASYAVSPENWKAATSYVVSVSGRQGACVMFYPQDGRMPFDYYVRRTGIAEARGLVPVLPTLRWGVVKPFVEQYAVPTQAGLKQIVASCPRLWLISSHEGQNNGPRLSGQNYVRYQRLVSQLGWVYPHQNLVQFGYAATVYAWQLSRTPIG